MTDCLSVTNSSVSLAGSFSERRQDCPLPKLTLRGSENDSPVHSHGRETVAWLLCVLFLLLSELSAKTHLPFLSSVVLNLFSHFPSPAVAFFLPFLSVYSASSSWA